MSTPYSAHSDSVNNKLTLLNEAYRSGRFDVAMSLAESLKGTLAFEKQTLTQVAPADLPAAEFGKVVDLAKPWAEWASGWKFFKTVTLAETVNSARQSEPFQLSLAVPQDQVDDFGRELRVARLETASGMLVEVPSQVTDEIRLEQEKQCTVTFLADVTAHGTTSYFLFFGNPHAERPHYESPLEVAGEGYGLEIDNPWYKAILSPSVGQLERLVSKRQHGLELYAGGKGHGEPPGIDWGHDYVDEGHFQKHRMRNWEECPNYEVIRGPLFVQVRRWGIPHSPMHPLFTPSRIHMDVTNTFYAHQPYFMKESRFDVLQDVNVEAMRDDEWVFSGYSFTKPLWIDRQGKLHEGPVPGEHSQHLWGVGFYHNESRDSFMALRLEHEADGFDLKHGGVPQMHYFGHGQLWSRYPVDGTARLKKGTTFKQKNAYLFEEYPKENPAGMLEGLRHQLISPLQLQTGDLPMLNRARALGQLARYGETEETAPLKPLIWRALAEVKDEQLLSLIHI